MAAFDFEGKTYFYSNGRWLNHNSQQVPAEIAEKLNKMYTIENIKEKEELQKKKQQLQKEKKSAYYTGSGGYGGYISGNVKERMRLSEIKKRITSHKIATEKVYKENIILTDEQKKALELLESGENVFLSGEAGTGKSYVVNEYIRRARGRNVIVCAPTGIAAINIGGATLHRVFNIPVKPLGPNEYTKNPSEALIKADTIIIDEISMCRFDVFEYVVKTIRAAEEMQQFKANQKALNKGEEIRHSNSKQLIVVGDFYQLPPVIVEKDRAVLETLWNYENIKEGFAFQTECWKSLNFKNIVLNTVIRQKGDLDFVRHLNMIRKGNVSGISWFNENCLKSPMPNSIYLCSTNRKADLINRKKSEELPGETVTYTAQMTGQVQESDKMTLDNLELKVGMQVMTLVNSYDESYKNGSLGKILSLEENAVKVLLNSGEVVEIKPYDWEIYGYEIQDDKIVKVVLGNYTQIPLKVAYAITIHKSQGQTYSSANISPDCFTAGQLYVALSRVKSIETMSLEHDIRKGALIVSDSVKEFYFRINENDEEHTIQEADKYVETENLNIPAERKKYSAYKKVQNMSNEELNSCYMYKTIKERPNAYSAWTKAEEEEILSELTSGMSIEDIAIKHCRTIGAIQSRLQKIQER